MERQNVGLLFLPVTQSMLHEWLCAIIAGNEKTLCLRSNRQACLDCFHFSHWQAAQHTCLSHLDVFSQNLFLIFQALWHGAHHTLCSRREFSKQLVGTHPWVMSQFLVGLKMFWSKPLQAPFSGLQKPILLLFTYIRSLAWPTCDKHQVMEVLGSIKMNWNENMNWNTWKYGPLISVALTSK